MKTNRRILERLFIAIIVLELIGCAALTVDVDVYKGPLANHEYVQVEQMAAMAIGAKQILVDLRDNLELRNTLFSNPQVSVNWWPTEHKSGDGWQDYRSLESLRSRGWYAAGYVPPRSDGRSQFWDHNAVIVNEILGLYDDQNQSELASSLERARRALYIDYVQARNILQVPDEKEDVDLWRDLDLDDFDPAEKAENLSPQLSQRCNLKHALNWLRDSYQKLFNSRDEHFISEDIVAATYQVLCWSSVARDEESIVPLLAAIRENPNPYIHSANAAFGALENPELVRFHADVIFGLNERDSAKFVDRVNEIAVSFRASRRALSDALESTLLAIILLNSSEVMPDYQLTLTNRDTVNLTGELIRLTQLDSLVYLSAPKRSIHANDLAQILPLVDALDAATHDKLQQTQGLGEQNDTLKRALIEALNSDPVGTASKLLQAHLYVQSAHFQEVVLPKLVADRVAIPLLTEQLNAARRTESPLGSRVFGKGWEYGLAAGPGSELPVLLKAGDPADLVMRFHPNSVYSIANAGLSGGRLKEGLETLVGRYAQASFVASGDRNDRTVQQTTAQLTGELVRFAEKILTIANRVRLLEPPGYESDGGLIPFALDATSRAAVGIDLRPPDPIDPYVRVLQAVGNSILIQADELTFRAEHRREHSATVAVAREQRALQRAFSRSSDDLFNELTDRVTAGGEGPAASVKEYHAQEIAATSTLASETARVASAEARFAFAESRASAEITRHAHRDRGVEVRRDLYADASETVSSAQASPGLQAFTQRFASSGAATKVYLRGIIGDIVRERDEQSLSLSSPVSPDRRRSLERLENTLLVLNWSDQALVGQSVSTEFHSALPSTPCSAEVRLVGILRQRWNENNREVELARTDLDIASAEVHRASEALLSARRDRDRATQELSRIQGQLARAREAQQRYQDADTVIKGLRRTVLSLLHESDSSSPGSAIHAIALTQLQNDLAAATATPEKTRLGNALGVLRSTPAPEDPMVDLADGAESVTDVIDSLIALLRDEHIRAVRQFGADSTQARHLAESLDAAWTHRSNQVFIRPSSAYLRTSFPSTSLQPDPNLSWENMLGAHAGRSVPFYPQLRDFMFPDRRRDALVNTELDKQFWQNINRVRVNGAGNTNYVLAKDDIGNWYVKAYSADSAPIIESAKNLALFAAGAGMGTNLLGGATGLDLPSTPENADPRNTTTPGQLRSLQQGTGRNAVERLYDSHAGRYVDQTTRTEQQILPLLKSSGDNSFVGQIGSVWAQDSSHEAIQSELTSALNSARTAHLLPIHDQIASPEERLSLERWRGLTDEATPALERANLRASRIREAIGAMINFEADLERRVGGIKHENVDEEILDRFQAGARSILRREVTNLLKERRDAVEGFEETIRFIAEAINPPPAN